MIQLTTIQSLQAHKLYELNNNQIKSRGQSLYSGTAKVIKLNSLDELLAYTDQDIALVHGIPEYELRCRQKTFQITTLDKENAKAKYIARAKKNFVYADEAIVLLDIDDLADANYQFTSIDNLLDDLTDIFPILKNKEVLAIPSSSNGLSDSRTDKLLNTKSNEKWHIYYRIKGSLIRELKQYLNDVAWVKGYGYAFVSKSGAIYERCIIDTTVFSPERLDYIGSIDDKSNLLLQNKPNYVHRTGNIIDSIPENVHTAQAQKLFAKQRKSKTIKAKVYNNAVTWLTERVNKNKETLTTEQIELRATQKSGQQAQYELLPDTYEIKVNGKNLSVGYIADNLKTLKGKYCADPITEELCKCRIVAASHAKYGFLLKSFKTNGFYCFGELPTLITDEEIGKGLAQLKGYLAASNKQFQYICSWRQAVLVDNEWVSFHQSFCGITTPVNILLAKRNNKPTKLRVLNNALTLMEHIQRYFNPWEYADDFRNSNYPKVAFLGGNAGNAKSYAANVTSVQSGYSTMFISNSNKNVSDYIDTFKKDCVHIEGNSNVLWSTLQNEYGHKDEYKKEFDRDVTKHYQQDALSLLESLDKWFEHKGKPTRTRKLRPSQVEQQKKTVKVKCFEEISWQASSEHQHQMLTLAKAQADLKGFKSRVKKQLELGRSIVVFMDEMDAVKANPQSGIVSVYEHNKQSELTGYANPVHADVEQAALMDFLYQTDGVFVVMLSAERGVEKALEAKGIHHVFINRFTPLLDNDLTLMYASSTSNKIKDDSSALIKAIAKINKKWPDFSLVINGLNEQQKEILKSLGVDVYTHEGLKGHNDKKQINFVSIISHPHPSEIQKYLLSIGINDENKQSGDEGLAISTLVSNRFNQTIGRNTGYRGESDSKHIALIPIALASLIKSDVVTTNHIVFDEAANIAPDINLLAKLVEAKLDADKAAQGLDELVSTKSKIKKDYIKPVVDLWNSENKQQVKIADIANKVFTDIVLCKKKRINGIPKDMCFY
jgi:hypothetical protein